MTSYQTTVRVRHVAIHANRFNMPSERGFLNRCKADHRLNNVLNATDGFGDLSARPESVSLIKDMKKQLRPSVEPFSKLKDDKAAVSILVHERRSVLAGDEAPLRQHHTRLTAAGANKITSQLLDQIKVFSRLPNSTLKNKVITGNPDKIVKAQGHTKTLAQLKDIIKKIPRTQQQQAVGTPNRQTANAPNATECAEKLKQIYTLTNKVKHSQEFMRRLLRTHSAEAELVECRCKVVTDLELVVDYAGVAFYL